MKYNQFSLLLKQNLNDISQRNIQILWDFYQKVPSLSMQKIYDLYRFCEDITLESLMNLCVVDSIINFYGYDTFDVLSLKDVQANIYKQFELCSENINPTIVEQDKILSYIKKVCMSKYKMYQNMQKNIRLFFANTLSFNFDDADVSLLEKNIKISEQLYNDLPFYLKIIAMNYEDMDIDIKEIILESYDVNDNLELSYQQRLNFILGYYYLSSEELMIIVEDIFEFYQNKNIPNQCKDEYFLYGLFCNCNIYLDTTNSNDTVICKGKRYFMNDQQNTGLSVLVQNINDYMYDLNIQEKNKKFLYGICLACIEESQKNSVKVYLKY